MRRPASPWLQLIPIVTTALVLSASLAAVIGVRVHHGGSPVPWWRRRWVHFCLWDRECQAFGALRRIYVFSLYVEFPDDRDTSNHNIIEKALRETMRDWPDQVRLPTYVACYRCLTARHETCAGGSCSCPCERGSITKA